MTIHVRTVVNYKAFWWATQCSSIVCCLYGVCVGGEGAAKGRYSGNISLVKWSKNYDLLPSSFSRQVRKNGCTVGLAECRQPPAQTHYNLHDLPTRQFKSSKGKGGHNHGLNIGNSYLNIK